MSRQRFIHEPKLGRQGNHSPPLSTSFTALLVSLFVIYLFEQEDVLAAIPATNVLKKDSHNTDEHSLPFSNGGWVLQRPTGHLTYGL